MALKDTRSGLDFEVWLNGRGQLCYRSHGSWQIVISQLATGDTHCDFEQEREVWLKRQREEDDKMHDSLMSCVEGMMKNCDDGK